MAANTGASKKRSRGMLGYYAGFSSRFVAMLIDVIIVITLVFIIYIAIRLPIQIFLGVDPNTCAPTDNQSLLAQIVGSIFPSSGTRTRMVLRPDRLRLQAYRAAGGACLLCFFLLGDGADHRHVRHGNSRRADGRQGHVILGWPSALGSASCWPSCPWDLACCGSSSTTAARAGMTSWRIRVSSMPGMPSKMCFSSTRSSAGCGATVCGAFGSQHDCTARRSADRHKLDLLTIAFPDYDRLDNVLDLIQDGIDDGKFGVVNATVLVKGDDDSVGVLAASDLDRWDQGQRHGG